MKHIMIDLETLGVNPGCVVLSIGACVFDRETVSDTFTVDLDVTDQTNHGLAIEGATLEWWLGNKLQIAGRFNVNLPAMALTELRSWLVEHRKTNQLRIWANSPMFDMAILEALWWCYHRESYYEEHKLPWSYWELRDYRTAVHCLDKPFKSIKPKSVAHRALQDAIDQAQLLIDHGFFKRYTEE